MSIGILGTGSYLPDQVLSSQELGERLGVGERWIVEKTGIRERRVAGSDQISSDLGAIAAERAIAAAGITAREIDYLIVSTSTPDQPVPATACFVQNKIGAAGAAAFDVMAGCTGSLHAIAVARALLAADHSKTTALVVGVGLYSRFLNYSDRRTCVLFGDGAGAVVLGRVDDGGIVAVRLASDGALAHVAEIPAGGSRLPASSETVASGLHYAMIRGGEIRRVVSQLLPNLVEELLELADWKLQDIDLVVPHQANGAMLDEWTDLLGIEQHLMYRTVEYYANTGAGSIPITLDSAVRSGRLRTGHRVLLLGVGAGVTWGGMTLQWVTP